MAFAAANTGIPQASAQQAQAQQQQTAPNTGLAQDFDTFLTILTTQLQAQNPLDPMDSQQFTDQLVNFAGVEQQIRSNDQLENIGNKLTTDQTLSAVGFLDKNAKVESDTGRLTDQDEGIAFSYRLPTNMQDTELKVLDASGKAVMTLEGAEGAGEHDFFMPAQKADGSRLPAGEYTLKVEAETPGGNSSPNVRTFVTERVDAVDTSGGEPLLSVGGRQVSLEDVLSLKTTGPTA